MTFSEIPYQAMLDAMERGEWLTVVARHVEYTFGKETAEKMLKPDTPAL